MGNITLKIPDDLHEKMKKHKHLKWSQMVREYIERSIKEIEEADYRLYSLKKLIPGEEAEDLFEF